MGILRSVWNYRPDPARYASLRARALRGLIFFLALMLCFTLISRAADSMTVATVSAGAPTRTALVRSFQLDGSVEAVDAVPVMVPAGVLVESVPVTKGDTVQEGELLLEYDPTELQRAVNTGQLELEKLRLQVRELEDKLEQESLEREREQEDLEQKELDRDLAVGRAQEDLEQATRRAEINVNNAVAQRDHARRELNSYDGDSDAEEAALREAYRSARREVEQAILDQTETLQRYQRALEDAMSASGAQASLPSASTQIQMQSLAIDIQIKQMEITWLQQSIDAGGQVFAPMDGVVGEISTAAGRTTTGEAAMTLTDTGSLRVTAQVSEEQKKLLGQGATLTLTGEDNRKLTGLTVGSYTPVDGESERYRIVVELPPDSGLRPYQSVELEAVRRSETYDSCVPLAALYQEGQSYYLLVLDEAQTVTGAETVVRRVDVTLQERNDSYAAVSGSLSSADRVVSAASKPLAAGDRVRLEQ